MTGFPFCKFHGFGNDYIVALRDDVHASLSLPELGKNVCDRHRGVGADGIAILEPLDNGEADYFCEIVNPDGSFAGFSGNGTRSAASFLYYKSLWTAEHLRLETRSGIKTFHLLETLSLGHYIFESEIGKPKFASDEVPFASDVRLDQVIDQPVSVNGREIRCTCVNVGNPVACVFVDYFNPDWRELGRALETHKAFPERANIVFVKVEDRENIDIRIWERAAGETAASGTSASGSAVLSALTERTGRQVAVRSEGGITQVNWRDDDEIGITGRADLAFCGQWDL